MFNHGGEKLGEGDRNQGTQEGEDLGWGENGMERDQSGSIIRMQVVVDQPRNSEFLRELG